MATCNPLKATNQFITGHIDNWLGSLGVYTAKRPGRVVLLSVLAALLFTCGFLVHFEFNNTGEEIWPPQDSEAFYDNQYKDERFQQTVQGESLLLTAKAPHTNIVTKAALVAAMGVYEKVEEVKTNGYGFTDFCLLNGNNECDVNSPLMHWGMNMTLLLADPDVAATTRSPYPDGSLPSPDDFGNWVGNTATAMQLNLPIDTQRVKALGLPDERGWELLLVAKLREVDDSYVNVYILAGRSIDDALEKALNQDMMLIVMGIMLMWIYAYAVLTRKLNTVQSRFALTWAASASIILGLIGGTGFISALGVTLTNLNQILIYVVMGIGIDDAFIIASSVDSVFAKARRKAHREGKPSPDTRPESEEFAQLYGKAVRQSGSSIAFTSLTDLVAFMFGSFTRIPAVQYFCYYAAMAVFGVFMMQITLFSAALVHDLKRQAAKKRDVIECSVVAAHDTTPPTDPDNDLSLVQRFMKHTYAPILVKNVYVKAIVVVVFTALAVMGAYGSTQVVDGLPLVDLTPKEHYARDYLVEVEKYWLGFQYSNVDLLFKHDLSTATEVQQQLGMYSARHAAAGQTTWVQAVSQGWWFASFLQYASAQPSLMAGLSTAPAPGNASATVVTWTPTAGTTWGTAVHSFVTAVPRFKSNVALTEVSPGVWSLAASTAHMLFRGHADPADVVDAMFETRDAVKAAATKHGLLASITNFFFLFTEMDAIQQEEAVQNMGLALAGVSLVCLVFLGSFKVTAVVVAMVLFIDVSLFGSLHYFSIKLNSVSVINLVLALGLAVDQCAHVAHRFMVGHIHEDDEDEEEGDVEKLKTISTRRKDLTPADRAIESLWVLGASVFNGGFSTFCAVAPLMLAGSQVFTTFFAMLGSIVVLGLAHGLIMLPVLLSFFPAPSPFGSSKRSKNICTSQPSAQPRQVNVLSVDDPDAGSGETGCLHGTFEGKEGTAVPSAVAVAAEEVQEGTPDAKEVDSTDSSAEEDAKSIEPECGSEVEAAKAAAEPAIGAATEAPADDNDHNPNMVGAEAEMEGVCESDSVAGDTPAEQMTPATEESQGTYRAII